MKVKFSILFLFFILNQFLFPQDIKVLSSDRNSIVVEYRPTIKDTAIVTSKGNTFIKINIAGTFTENYLKQGLPQIQVREVNIGVPNEIGNTIQLLGSDYSTMNGKYIPCPELDKDSLGFKEIFFEGEGYPTAQSPELVTFGDYGLVRNLPVQTIKIHPVIFDASTNSIKLFSKVIFKINFGAQTGIREIVNNELNSIVLNWNVAKNWGMVTSKLQKISSSVLAAGDWYRFEAPEEGIYKIDNTFLQALGIDLNSVDPRTIKIYNNGGYALTEDLTKTNNQGLIENAITVVGEADGKFDSGDYIIFYGRPPEFWEYNSSSKSIVRTKTPYSKKNYYWLTYGGVNGKRISSKASLNISNAYKQQTTLAFKSQDKDSINIGKSGRDYLGDVLDNSTNSSKSRTYISTLSGIVPSSLVSYKFRVVNGSSAAIPYAVQESGNNIYSNTLPGNYRYVFGVEDVAGGTYAGLLADDRSTLKFSISSGSSAARLYIDYFEITYQRQLKAAGDNLLVFSKDTTSDIEYTLTNFSNSLIQAYDVTDFANVKVITNAAINGGQFQFKASETKGNISKYLAITTSAYKTPINAAKIANSNIRGNTSGSEMIVITAKDFKTQAERYASYRSNQSPYKLTTQIFYVDEIFNEFSCGMVDPTAIRDFLKFAYDNWKIKPFYVMLFGDGDYDYLNTEKLNRNFVPPFETAESLFEVLSYPMDDYYARVSGNDLKIDLAMGRINIQSSADAEIAVDKIIKYETGLEKGLWRNKITLVADDGPQEIGIDDGSVHTAQSEELAINRIPKYFDLDKIYLAAYPTVYTGVGRRKPEVNKAIINSINDGTLILNYVGHGNPSVWAHESVFERAVTIPQLKNQNYFFLTAATCDFGKYDDPDEQSSTELLLNMKDAGAIGAFSAARVVESFSNAAINESLYNELLSNKDVNYLPIRVGNAYFLAKQSRTNENDEKFHLFGDPAIRLDEPVTPSTVDSVNGKSLTSNVQISALSPVKIVGTVRNANGTPSQFNGSAVISVYDSERSLYLQEMNYTIKLQGGLIYRGIVTITNGSFETEFVVPKDISYENKNGKIVAYFSNNSTDGVGYTTNVIVGGTNPNAVNDGKGPAITIYFDDLSFESSYLVNPDFTLLAKLSDGTGLNTTGTGIGHKLEGILNDNETNPIDFTNSYVGDLNSGGKSGLIKYKFTGMTPGDYKIKVKAWDVFNNFSSQEANFTVVSSNTGIVLRDVVNYPNPFSSNTTFTFMHNVTSAINIKIKIYTIAGRLIKQIEESNVLDKFVKVDWDGRDADENQIANGTYLYKLIVESVDGKYKDNVLGKLAVIR